MAKKGMDVAQGAQVVQTINEAAQHVSQHFQNAADQVNGLDWTGDDASEYKSTFSGEVADAVSKLADQLQQRSQELDEDVQQQNKVSAD